MELPLDTWGIIYAFSDPLLQYVLKCVCKDMHAAVWPGTRSLSELLDGHDIPVSSKQWVCRSEYRKKDHPQYRIPYLMSAVKNYDSDTSLMVRFRFDPIIRDMYRLSFKVYMSLGEHTEIYNPNQYLDLESIRFLDRSPIRRIACHGDKCRRSVSLEEDRIWCESCHGDMGLYEVFNTLLIPPCWNEIPKEDILSIRVQLKEFAPTDPDMIRHRTRINKDIQTLQEQLAPGGYHDQLRTEAEQRLAALLAGVTWND